MHTRNLNRISGTMLDTFEGHLRKNGQLLIQAGGKIALVDLCSGEWPEQLAVPGWAFSTKLSSGVIGDRLRKVSSLRAFSEVAALKVERYGVVVLDELEKTVARAWVTQLEHGRQRATWVALEPSRGCDIELGLVANALVAAGYEPSGPARDYYPVLGIERTLYTSKPDVEFNCDTPIYETATRIADAFLRVAHQNEAGILSDCDTEFLHDYRVSLRRARSLLSLFRDVYGTPDCRVAKAELASIMKQTNRLRDLDVYLMDRDKFLALVPDSMHRGLYALFDIFSKERQEAFQQVCAYLNSLAYRELMADLQRRFGEADGMVRGNVAGEATGHFACCMVMKHYRKVAKLARSISRTTPDETVHALRIHCKKLRYLMEFFAPLFEEDAVKPLVKMLKGLQDGLGRFNDCSVQRVALSAFVEEHRLRGKMGLQLAESVGALVATLYQMQLRARSEIDVALGDLVNNHTHECFLAVFSGEI